MTHKEDKQALKKVSTVILEAVYSLFGGTLINAVKFKWYTFSYTEDYRVHFKRHIGDEATAKSVLYVSVF